MGFPQQLAFGTLRPSLSVLNALMLAGHTMTNLHRSIGDHTDMRKEVEEEEEKVLSAARTAP